MIERRSWSEAFCNHVERRRERERRPMGFVMTDAGPKGMFELKFEVRDWEKPLIEEASRRRASR